MILSWNCDFIKGGKMLIFCFSIPCTFLGWHSFVKKRFFFSSTRAIGLLWDTFPIEKPSHHEIWQWVQLESTLRLLLSTIRDSTNKDPSGAEEKTWYWSSEMWFLDRCQVFETTQEPQYQHLEISSELDGQQVYRPSEEEPEDRGQVVLVFQMGRRKHLGIG